jgi:hypothetical protein
MSSMSSYAWHIVDLKNECKIMSDTLVTIVQQQTQIVLQKLYSKKCSIKINKGLKYQNRR